MPSLQRGHLRKQLEKARVSVFISPLLFTLLIDPKYPEIPTQRPTVQRRPTKTTSDELAKPNRLEEHGLRPKQLTIDSVVFATGKHNQITVARSIFLRTILCHESQSSFCCHNAFGLNTVR